MAIDEKLGHLELTMLIKLKHLDRSTDVTLNSCANLSGETPPYKRDKHVPNAKGK